MTFFERLEELRKSKKISQGKLEKELGFSNGSISKWKTSMPTPERLQKIADYFGVSIEYLMSGKDEAKDKSSELTARDERDIAKDLNNIMEKLAAGEAGPASYNGEELDPEAADLFRDELELALKRLKVINKEKYTNKRYKKQVSATGETERIKRLVAYYKKIYGTNNPFEIADRLGVLYQIGNCKHEGCYMFLKNHRYIFLSNRLSGVELKVVMAHELAHAIFDRKD